MRTTHVERGTPVVHNHSWGISRRRFSDIVLFVVTSAELVLLIFLTPTFTAADWLYVLQHLMVLGIALTRSVPEVLDRSLSSALAVAASYAYPYAQVIYLRWVPGDPVWPEGGLFMITLAAFLSFSSLLALGRLFGVRPALRGLATRGPYRFVRHPMYLSYVIGDIGYNFQEWNLGTVLMVMAGWVSLGVRIGAEEKILAGGTGWANYTRAVRYRLLPGLW